MREKISQVEYDEEEYGLARPNNSSNVSKRLDLNDLIKRAKDQEKNDKKINLLIYTGAAFVIAIFAFILSI